MNVCILSLIPCVTCYGYGLTFARSNTNTHGPPVFENTRTRNTTQYTSAGLAVSDSARAPADEIKTASCARTNTKMRTSSRVAATRARTAIRQEIYTQTPARTCTQRQQIAFIFGVYTCTWLSLVVSTSSHSALP